MKLKLLPAAHELISNMRSFFQTSNAKLSHLNEEPLRAELFSSDQMDRFGKALATTHKLNKNPVQSHLLKRLTDNEIILQEVRKLLNDSIKRKYQVTPAGEWLIDNFYLIEEHIRIAKTHFPKNYSQGLPQLLAGTTPGPTRIYDIVLQIISHSDGKINMESLSRFLNAYQMVTHLRLGELWAIPIMIRLALIENIRRVAARIAIDRVDSNLADYWAVQMIETTKKDPKSLISVIAEMALSNPPMVSTFVSEITRQLAGKGPDLALSLHWINQQLAANGLSSTELVNAEIQKQAANQVSISNSIGSLRMLGAMDWRDFVETHSIVEQTLRQDNGGIYGSMNFSTRDRYRHVVETIAMKSELSEHEVAAGAIALMVKNMPAAGTDQRSGHVGYYLIGDGLAQTIKMAKMRVSVMQKIRKIIRRIAFPLYLTFIFFIAASIAGVIFIQGFGETKNSLILILIGLLALLCSSELAISVVNFFSTLFVQPELLPRMDFSLMIPPGSRTLVVIPSMLTKPEEIERLVEGLEVRFLANRNNNLHFGLLTDFTDAAAETLPGDKQLVDKVNNAIKDLNKKYHREKDDLFFLFHRPRSWNQTENVWMGYERKRGKISDLNDLLRGNAKKSFSLVTGDQSLFPLIKYVITLDADTQLPLGSAWKLIGTMDHPLNHAWYDEKRKRVTKGYGILQPRITVSLPDITSSRYTRMHGNEPGIDPYTRASSDVYQDLFSEGSFIGKGIYDLDTFQRVLDTRFSENRILSHDLLEGCYIRSGLLSDVQLFEKYPNTYSNDIAMRLRWIRGDWQIFSWLFPLVIGPRRKLEKNPVSPLSRWKIFDNIRRSLVPIALTALLLLGWLVMDDALFWTIAVSFIIVFPVFVASLWDTISKPRDIILTHHIRNSLRSTRDIAIKTFFTLICLPYQAFSNLVAIMQTLWRMIFTGKNLLEWNPSRHGRNENEPGLRASYASMWFEPFLAFFIFTYLIIFSPARTLVAGPILILWIIAPFITWFISSPIKKQVATLTIAQGIFLQKLARKTWSFFERFVTAQDNWLPADNFQERPIAQIAHRTSPTNIGLSLLTALTARDFGYITVRNFIERTTMTIHTLKKMERYKGHFFNWYDTESLTPLLPKYISTVDSGNFAAHLLVLRQGLVALAHQKIISEKLFEGLLDTCRVLIDILEEKDALLIKPFETELEAASKSDLISHQDTKLRIDVLAKNFSSIAENLGNDPQDEICWWKETLAKQMVQIQEELEIFAPWCGLTPAPPKFTNEVSIPVNVTFIELLNTAKKMQVNKSLQNSAGNLPEENNWLALFQGSLTKTIQQAAERIAASVDLAKQCNEIADMEWDFLYNKSSNLFSIGYSVAGTCHRWKLL
jgi:cyclic beta-1,2-glucan synthetase